MAVFQKNTSGPEAVECLAELIRPLLGVRHGLKCVVDGDNEVFLRSTALLLQNLDIQHPVGQYLVSVCLSYHKIYGTAVKSLLFLIGSLMRMAASQYQKGVPLVSVLSALEVGVEQCQKIMDQLKLPVPNVKEEEVEQSQNVRLEDSIKLPEQHSDRKDGQCQNDTKKLTLDMQHKCKSVEKVRQSQSVMLDTEDPSCGGYLRQTNVKDSDSGINKASDIDPHNSLNVVHLHLTDNTVLQDDNIDWFFDDDIAFEGQMNYNIEGQGQLHQTHTNGIVGNLFKKDRLHSTIPSKSQSKRDDDDDFEDCFDDTINSTNCRSKEANHPERCVGPHGRIGQYDQVSVNVGQISGNHDNRNSVKDKTDDNNDDEFDSCFDDNVDQSFDTNLPKAALEDQSKQSTIHDLESKLQSILKLQAKDKSKRTQPLHQKVYNSSRYFKTMESTIQLQTPGIPEFTDYSSIEFKDQVSQHNASKFKCQVLEHSDSKFKGQVLEHSDSKFKGQVLEHSDSKFKDQVSEHSDSKFKGQISKDSYTISEEISMCRPQGCTKDSHHLVVESNSADFKDQKPKISDSNTKDENGGFTEDIPQRNDQLKTDVRGKQKIESDHFEFRSDNQKQLQKKLDILLNQSRSQKVRGAVLQSRHIRESEQDSCDDKSHSSKVRNQEKMSNTSGVHCQNEEVKVQDSWQEIKEVARSLSHGDQDMMDVVVDATIQQHRHLEGTDDPVTARLNLDLLHSVVTQGHLRPPCLVKGVVMTTSSAVMSLVHQYKGRILSTIMVSGDIKPSYHHIGYKRPLDVQKTQTAQEFCQTSRSPGWLHDIEDILRQFSIDCVLVRGTINENVKTMCETNGILAIENVPYKMLQTMCRSVDIAMTTYVLEVTKKNVCRSITMDPYEETWMTGCRETFVKIMCDKAPLQTCVISHPTVGGGSVMEQDFWRCANILSSLLMTRFVLPGGGKTEQLCSEALISKSAAVAEEKDTDQYEPSVLQAMATALHEYTNTVKLNTAQHHTAGSGPSASSENGLVIYDDYRSKRAAIATACNFISTVLMCDTYIMTGVSSTGKSLITGHTPGILL